MSSELADSVITGRELQEMLGLTRAQRRFWTDGRLLNLPADGGQGLQGVKTALFTKDNSYLFALVIAAIEGQAGAKFEHIGKAVDCVREHPEWSTWKTDRGLLTAIVPLQTYSRSQHPDWTTAEHEAFETRYEPKRVQVIYMSRADIDAGKLAWVRERSAPLAEGIARARERMREHYAQEGKVPPAASELSIRWDLRNVLGAIDVAWARQIARRGRA